MSDEPGVSIGQAAALYGLTPSALRWWEAQGVLPEPPRVNGRRVYTEAGLRRIGLAYLCCVTGAMPLDRAAVVTSGTSRNQAWRATVAGQIELIEATVDRLQAAHAFLRHLLLCPDDDIVRQCPDLDGELADHTPRGRVGTAGLVAAARSIPARVPADGRRDESDPARDKTGMVTDRCVVCAGPFARSPRGRRRRYCSRACRQRRYRENVRRAE